PRLFARQARAGDYDGALNTLAIARDNGHVEPNVALRRRAILLTAEARDAESAHPEKALRLAKEAPPVAPLFVSGRRNRRARARLEEREPARLAPDRADVEAFAPSRSCSRLRLRPCGRPPAAPLEATK